MNWGNYDGVIPQKNYLKFSQLVRHLPVGIFEEVFLVDLLVKIGCFH